MTANGTWEDARPRLVIPLGIFANWLLTGLVVSIALGFVDIALFAPVRFAVLRSQATEISPSDAGLLLVGTMLDLAQALVFGLVAVMFIFWLYNARVNLVYWGFAALKWGPGWALGGWFLPVANLIVPKLVVDTVWSASAVPHDQSWAQRRSSGLVWAWWLVFLGSIAGAVAFGGVTFSLSDPAVLLVGMRALATLPSMVAAVLAFLVVRTITLRQDARLASTQSGHA